MSCLSGVCLEPITHHANDRSFQPISIQHPFAAASVSNLRSQWQHLAFAFAGLYEHWEGSEGEMIDSCSIIVTEAK
ncbi:MAG: hypothetical protein AB2693_33050, partial [Candidatus Thiodiazotropha sp.]